MSFNIINADTTTINGWLEAAKIFASFGAVFLGAFLSSLLSYKLQKKKLKYDSVESQKQRDFQEAESKKQREHEKEIVIMKTKAKTPQELKKFLQEYIDAFKQMNKAETIKNNEDKKIEDTDWDTFINQNWVKDTEDNIKTKDENKNENQDIVNENLNQ